MEYIILLNSISASLLSFNSGIYTSSVMQMEVLFRLLIARTLLYIENIMIVDLPLSFKYISEEVLVCIILPYAI